MQAAQRMNALPEATNQSKEGLSGVVSGSTAMPSSTGQPGGMSTYGRPPPIGWIWFHVDD